MSGQREYRPDGETLVRYLASNPYAPAPGYAAPVACIQGPVRSGKSVASIMRIYMAMLNAPITQGKRRSRWLVIRTSYPDLLASTIKTWLEWFPEKLYGEFRWTPPYKHHMRFGDVEADVEFESFAGEDDIPSLKSREYTGAWINEAQFYTRRFCVAVYERTGWFPVTGGPKFLQLDMNAPPLGHWVPIMRGDAPPPEEWTESERRAHVKPKDWQFLVQPAWFVETLDPQGSVLEYKINPEAENLNIVGERAVYELLDGRTTEEIDADLMNRVMLLQSGRPVFPMFRRDTFVSKGRLSPNPHVKLVVGLDFGRQPAAVVMQNVGGRWFVLKEILGTNMSAVTFAPILRAKLHDLYADWLVEGGPGIDFWGDPSGANTRSETDDSTSFGIYEQNGMHVRAADKGNRRKPRIETMTAVLGKMIDGQPAIVFDEKGCPTLVTGMAGGYVYRRKRVSGAPVYEDEPLKNQFSHPIDAMIEVLMGGGETRAMLGRGEKAKPINTLQKADVFARGPRVPGAGRGGVFAR
jgi:hypothetical protein